jgi:hypothetical protein
VTVVAETGVTLNAGCRDVEDVAGAEIEVGIERELEKIERTDLIAAYQPPGDRIPRVVAYPGHYLWRPLIVKHTELNPVPNGRRRPGS